jgi:hypothetical protein
MSYFVLAITKFSVAEKVSVGGIRAFKRLLKETKSKVIKIRKRNVNE